MLTRRQMLKWGVMSGGTLLVPVLYKGRRLMYVPSAVAGDADFPSPPTTPFVDPLPFPPLVKESPFVPDPLAGPGVPRAGARFIQIKEEQALIKLHRDLPETAIWRYRDIQDTLGRSALGPTFKVQVGSDNVNRRTLFVRFHNDLPPDHPGFGVPCTTVHLHGSHNEARSDGFPENVEDFPAPVVFVPPGFAGCEPPPDGQIPHGCRPEDAAAAPHHYDYCYEMEDSGFVHGEPDPEERSATMWYHDHIFDFTGPNVYRGLAGMYLVFDELDNDDEADHGVITTGAYVGRQRLGLPSGPFDVPLVFQDKRLDARAQLVYVPGNHDGFLGDKFLVNGKIQPYLRVKRRKYRFRLLNGSNARFYRFFLADSSGRRFRFDHIGNEGGLFFRTIRDRDWVQLANAERADIVIDFRRFREGSVLYLENRLRQDDGRGPGGDFDDPDLVDRGTRLLQFRVEEEVADPSRVLDELRPREATSAAEIAAATRRTFVFERRHGAWAINGRLAELDAAHSIARPRLAHPELWRLVNKSGGWWHPIHIHLDFMHILSRNGKVPPLDERDGNAEKDVVLLGPNDVVEAFIEFKDYPGPWVFHCHNIEHEDMRMMARFDAVS